MSLARVLLLLAVVIWGWTFVATKVCLEHMSPIELIALRFPIAVPVLLVLIRVRGVRLDFRSHRLALSAGAVLFALHFAVQITGLEYTSATHTGWIIAVTPLVLALLAGVLLGERIGRNTKIGIAVATAGILVLVSDGNFRGLGWLRSPGDWLVLASAHTWALYTIVTRGVTRSRDPLAVTFAVLLPLAVLSPLAAMVRSGGPRLPELPFDAVLALLFLGIFGTALAHWFWQAGVARVGAAEAGVFLFLEPLATTAVAVPYLGEPFGASTLVGGLMVLAGVWYARAPRVEEPG